MTFDCGVSRETGEDPLKVLEYMASKDRINHVHYRNVIVEKPYEKYEEVFLDEGQVNMFAVMRELIKSKYKFAIYPEHPRALDYDQEHEGGIKSQYPGGGGYAALTYNVAYSKAMMQAVASA
jgi:mannonate dehydratase